MIMITNAIIKIIIRIVHDMQAVRIERPSKTEAIANVTNLANLLVTGATPTLTGLLGLSRRVYTHWGQDEYPEPDTGAGRVPTEYSSTPIS